MIARVVALLVILGLIVTVVVDSLTSMTIMRWFDDFLGWLKENIAVGSVVFACVYAIATVAFVPGSLLTLGAGFVFSAALGQGLGIVVATLVVFVGASIGSIAAFFLGRWVLRGSAEALARRYRVLKAIDTAVQRSGLRLMVLLRLSPLIPFSVFNYVAAVTAVRARDFLLAMPAILPGTAAYCYFGSLLTSVRQSLSGHVPDPVLQWVLLGVGIVATTLALVLVTRYARHEISTTLAEARQEEEREEAEAEEADEAGGAESREADDDEDTGETTAMIAIPADDSPLTRPYKA